MNTRDEREAAAQAAFKAAQSVYRADHDHFPLQATWESTDERVREGWRTIANAVLSSGQSSSQVTEDELAKVIAPFFQDGFTARDAANAVVKAIHAKARGESQ